MTKLAVIKLKKAAEAAAGRLLMCKALRLTLLLVVSAICLQAEMGGGPSDKGQESSGPTTIQGCLKMFRGQYDLTESNGTSHLLSGAARKLGPLVGHEIKVTGKPGTRTEDTTTAGGASSVREYSVFEVKSVMNVADTCKTVAQ